MPSINSKDIIDSEKFSKIADFIFSEFTSTEDFRIKNKNSDKMILETKNEEKINYVWYVSNKLNISNNSIIFCQTDLIEHFFSVLNNYKNLQNIILISHQSDTKVTKKLFNLKPPSVTKWFSTNVCYDHKDLIPIPIGVNNSFYEINPSIDDFNEMKTLSFNEKQEYVYVNFNVNTNQFHRHAVLKHVSNKKSFVIEKDKISKSEYLKKISKYKYTLCPWGNGFDTHRVWESIYVGSIPILKSKNSYKFVSNLPLLNVSSFKNIEIDKLNLDTSNVNLEKTKFKYWDEFINSEKKLNVTDLLVDDDITTKNQLFRSKKVKLQKYNSLKKRIRNIIFKVYKKINRI